MQCFVAEITYLVPIETAREKHAEHRALIHKGYGLGLFLCASSKSDPSGSPVRS